MRRCFVSLACVFILTAIASAQPRPWQPKPAAKDAPVKPYRCRIVSYADKWTRHGFSVYMAWRAPNGPLAERKARTEIFQITRDLDVDGDGRMDDDYVASLPFSLTEPLSNPDWPQHMAFPQRRNWRFYGGVSWYVSNSTPEESPFWVEQGYNPDHSPPWFDGRAEDHPLQGQANEKKPDSFHRHYWAIVWKKEDFLNDGDKHRVTFDDSSRLASITTRNYWLGYDDVRMIVQDGDQLYISDNQQFDIPKNGYEPARGRVFLLHPTKVTWARYEPKGHFIHLDQKNAKFAKHEFTDVRAVGWYLAKDRLEGKQSHLKWYGFEADAVVHRPEQGSVNIAMAKVPASPGAPEFWMAACELPYAKWKDVHRYGDSPFHTLEARYIYLRDGDMGSMAFGNKPHGPDEPVTNITWWDALAFCNTLSEMEGKTPCYYVDPEFKEVFRNMEFATRAIAAPFESRNVANPTYETVPPPRIHVRWDADGHRLPTPAEWQAAWKAGDHRPLTTDHRLTNGTQPVGSEKADAAGLHDLLGNVWELCWSHGDVFDPAKADTLLALGGDFNHPATASASPYGDEPWNGSYNLGLRLVCRKPGAPKPALDPAPTDASIPVWKIRKGEKAKAVKEAQRAEKPLLDMVALPGGSFSRSPDLKKITVSAFDMAKFPTTFEKWKDVRQWAEAKGYTFSRTGAMGSMYFFEHPHSPDEPVTFITWHDILVWCNALSEMEGRTPCYYVDDACEKAYRNAFTYRPLKVSGPELVAETPHRYAQYSFLTPQPWVFTRWDTDGYRLPTVAEYEYAVRGGTQTPYFWGDDEAQKDKFTWNIANAGGRTHPVGQKQPNPFGLCDIQGNVHQWLFSADGKRNKVRPYALDTTNPKASPYWAYKQPKEIYAPLASAHAAGGSWLCGGYNLNGQHGVTVEPQNVIDAALYYADVGFRVVRCKANTHPRDGLEKLGEWTVVIDINPKDYDPLEGATFRGNLCRTGAYQTSGVAQLKGVKWQFNTGGPVKSSPVVVNGVVYVGSDGGLPAPRPSRQAGHFHALDAATGQEKWKLAVEGGVMSSACVAGGVAYFGGNDGNLYAVDAATGQVKWKAEGQGRLTCSPAVAYGIVFMEGCWGFDAKTGKPVWSTTRQRLRGSDDDRLSSLGLHRDILIHNGSVLDIKTARHLTGTGDTWASQNTEPFADSAIYDLNSGVGGAVNLPRLIATDRATGRSKWTQNIVSPGQSANERKVVLCSPAVWDGKVFLGFDGGLMFAFDAAKGNKLWTFEAGGAIRSSPSVSAQDGLLYFGSHDGHLYALDARTGHERWRFKTAGKVTSSPCPADGLVFVGSDDGHLYALEGK